MLWISFLREYSSTNIIMAALRRAIEEDCHEAEDSVPARGAINVLESALRLYKPEEIAMSFNGGKDATVLLHLLRAAAAGDGGDEVSPLSLVQIRCVYFERDNVFDEVEDFIRQTESTFGLEIVRFRCSFKEGCQAMVEHHGIKAFLLGTRKSDPHGQFVEFFSPSTPGWPPFMRIHPLLLWTFEDVWRFLLSNQLAYCSLYDHGYTSLGETHNSRPNPLLQLPDGSFRPAHTLYLGLEDQHLERKSRVDDLSPHTHSSNDPPRSGESEGQVKSGPRSLGKALKSSEQEGGNQESGTAGEAGDGIRRLTVGLVTIGNEVLSAKVQDINTGQACRYLREQGIRVEEVLILPDDELRIARAVQDLGARCGAIITMGGIGPTHDDVTASAVARALGCPLQHCPEMAALLSERCASRDVHLESDAGTGMTNDVSRMCMLPRGTRLLFRSAGDEGRHEQSYPLLKCAKVYMLPGVPRFCREQLEIVGEDLAEHGQQRLLYCRQLRTSVHEPFLAQALAGVAQRFRHQVDIGCYPYFVDEAVGDAPRAPHAASSAASSSAASFCATAVPSPDARADIRTIVTLEGYDLERVEAALAMVSDAIPPGALSSIEHHGVLPPQH